MLQRHLTLRLLQSLGQAPAVYLAGPRQCGKSTLVRRLAETSHPARYLTFDDLQVLAAAQSDPVAFVAGLDGPTVLDEVQRCPQILLPLKASVDRDRRPGRFLLTGSASVLAVPSIAEALVGRVEVLALHPFSQGEIEAVPEQLVDALFAREPLPLGELPEDPTGITERIARGGFPEAVQRPPGARRADWFDAYTSTLLARDVRDLAAVEGLTRLPDLLRLLAARTAGLTNIAELARSTQLPQTTLRRYTTLLEAVFLISRLPAWSPNLGKRLVRSPKVFLYDSGLAAHLRGELGEGSAKPASGPLLETFVHAELAKQLTWSGTRARLHHFRSHAGAEVDFVLEDPSGRCVGIEVKSTTTIGTGEFQGLRRLAELVGPRFVRGVVLYPGRHALPFGPNLHALPIQALWRLGSTGAAPRAP